jgi:SAM-dependent methyltransferase
MARNVLLILISATCAWTPAFAQDSDPDAWRKPDQLVRALQLKRSDVVAVLEPEPFLAPRIVDRARSLVNLDNAPEHSIDVVVLYDVLHGIDHRPEFYAKLRRALRPDGRVVNIDFLRDPPSSARSEPKLPEPQAVQEFITAGFHVTKTVAFLPFQYFQVLE